MTITLPIKTVSESNRRGHWTKHAKRHKDQRGAAMLAVRCAGPFELPLVVTITRIAPRALDLTDNLPGSQKSVRDGIADGIGIDDRDQRVEWRYDQRRGRPKEYAVEIRIERVERKVA